ncbi:Uncharacterised protein [Mycobacteroides abscessus subsp. abscessus]|uniref:hypothetical protein n=1 Tax=Mycobacteroides abscessus TaxID=36809 RepID=UPI0009268026|nr:hypothetical protein [Mycobacteroides abscessus]SIJ95762.1 Uncharacterised protein [Mycobacteroides abscessus subsp. abscessus]
MTDPAVEAARKAGTGWLTGEEAEVAEGLKVIAAREALRPIRAVYERWERLYGSSRGDVPEMVQVLLESFAPLIFTTEEINQ